MATQPEIPTPTDVPVPSPSDPAVPTPTDPPVPGPIDPPAPDITPAPSDRDGPGRIRKGKPFGSSSIERVEMRRSRTGRERGLLAAVLDKLEPPLEANGM